jgi:hypothetical protein
MIIPKSKAASTRRTAWSFPTLALASMACCFLNGCALDPGAYEPPTIAGIDVALTPLQQFGDGSAPLMTEQGGRRQLGHAAAVAARGGQIFVVDSSIPGVVHLGAGQGNIRLLLELKDGNTRGIHVTADLIVYVVDRHNRAVIEVTDSGWQRRVYSDSDRIPAPVDVTEINWGATVLVADELTQRLVMFDTLSNPRGFLAPTLAPVAMAASIEAIAATGDTVFVLDAASREVTQLNLEGRPVGTYGEDALLVPIAMTVDECQRVFVADGHPDGLFVSSPDFYGTSTRSELPAEINQAVTDLWIDGNELYVAAGPFGVRTFAVEPVCLGVL